MNKIHKVINHVLLLILCIAVALTMVSCGSSKESIKNGMYIHLYSSSQDAYSDDIEMIPECLGSKSLYEKLLSDKDKENLNQSVYDWYDFFEYYSKPPKESTLQIEGITYIKEYEFSKDGAVNYYKKFLENDDADYRDLYLDFGNPMYVRSCNQIKLNPPAVNKYYYNDDVYIANDEDLQQHLFDIARQVNMIVKNYYDV